MKYLTLISLIALLACAGCLFTGCATQPPALLTSKAVRSEIGTGVQIGLLIYPAAEHDVALGRDVICNESKKTNATPVSIVADLQAAGITNATAKVIINGGIFVFERVYSLLGTNATTKIQPYIEAMCEGFTDGLPSSNPITARKQLRKSLPPYLK